MKPWPGSSSQPQRTGQSGQITQHHHAQSVSVMRWANQKRKVKNWQDIQYGELERKNARGVYLYKWKIIIISRSLLTFSVRAGDTKKIHLHLLSQKKLSTLKMLKFITFSA